jgi:hypothetical protein
MIRERALKIVMVLGQANGSDSGDDMMLSLYITLGIFLLIAVRNPSANRNLIAFTAWSSFAHAVVMSALAFQHQYASERGEFLAGSGVLVIIGVVLIALAPVKQSAAVS